MDRLVDDACALATTMGLLRSDYSDFKSFSLQRFTLLPTPVRKCEFAHALRLATVLNKLTLSMAADHGFLRRALRRTAAADPSFTARLLDLLPDADPSSRCGIEFAVNRYDFFLDAATDPDALPEHRGLRLVELNCIAAGGVLAAHIMTQLHSSVAKHPALHDAGLGGFVDLSSQPKNNCDQRLAESITHAHRCFQARYGVTDARVVMVVIPPYHMRADHAVLQWHAIRDGVDMLRMTLADIATFGSLNGAGHLEVIGFAGSTRFPVSVAYFRTGYMPEEYPTEMEWNGRRLLEMSTAACCPSVAMQLVGTKKMQQVIGEDGVLEMFLNAEESEVVRETLVRQWDASDEHAVRRAMHQPESYVLKPQREGGGNNLTYNDMKRVLQKLSLEELAAFTLMERICAAEKPNVIVEAGVWWRTKVQSELGMFSTVIAVDGEIVENRTVGHGLKSKEADTDEGGVDCGRAGLGSVTLQ